MAPQCQAVEKSKSQKASAVFTSVVASVSSALVMALLLPSNLFLLSTGSSRILAAVHSSLNKATQQINYNSAILAVLTEEPAATNIAPIFLK